MGYILLKDMVWKVVVLFFVPFYAEKWGTNIRCATLSSFQTVEEFGFGFS